MALHQQHLSAQAQLSGGALPGVLPGSLPGALPGVLPGALPGVLPGALPGSLPGAMPGVLPTAVPQVANANVLAAQVTHSAWQHLRFYCANERHFTALCRIFATTAQRETLVTLANSSTLQMPNICRFWPSPAILGSLAGASRRPADD